VNRLEEVARYNATIDTRVKALDLDPLRPLSLEDCEAIALKNNLQYRVTLLETRLQDEQVRKAFSGYLPTMRAQFSKTRRNNDPLIEGGAGATFTFEDIEIDAFSIKALIPILDFGTTYYAHQIAKDRRMQERIAAVRARQHLLRDVRVAFAGYAAALRQERLARTAVEAARNALKVAQSLEREGFAARSDTAFVEASLAQAEFAHTTTRHNMLDTRALLCRAISVPIRKPFTIVDTLPQLPRMPTMAEVPGIEQSALKARPELWVQDLSRHMAANNVRKSIAAFLPRVDGITNFDWSSNSFMVNPAFISFGFTVSQSLLEGTSRIWNHKEAKKRVDVEKERALLMAMGVVLEVDYRLLRLLRAHETIASGEKVVASQKELLKVVESRHRENLETGANLSRALAELRRAEREFDRIRTNYLVAWYELEAAALPGETVPPDAAQKELPDFVAAEPAAGAAAKDENASQEPSLQNTERHHGDE
jgi:outer membrane protein TolC